MKSEFVVWLMVAGIVVALGGLFIFLNGDGSVVDLDSVEVQKYEGEMLSSVHDFRENSIRGVQHIDIDDYALRVFGLVGENREFSYDEVIDRQSYSKVVTLNCVEGWSATILWEGIILRELLEEVDIMDGANTIIFHAEDGYTVAYPIEYIMDGDILMAYKMNGETMIPARGFPFQLVAEDRWGYRWIKWITGIEFSDDSGYTGYWESRGYDDEGFLAEGFLG